MVQYLLCRKVYVIVKREVSHIKSDASFFGSLVKIRKSVDIIK